MVDHGIFRQYDIRGVVDTDLTVDAVHAIGRAFAALLAERGIAPRVVVGRDNRPSGERLRDALVEGLTENGVAVTDVGVVPTPVVYWCLHHLDVAAGIQITGSHNPPSSTGSSSPSAPRRYTAMASSDCTSWWWTVRRPAGLAPYNPRT